MNVAQKIIAIMGTFYVLIGGAISIVFLFAFWGTPGVQRAPGNILLE